MPQRHAPSRTKLARKSLPRTLAQTKRALRQERAARRREAVQHAATEQALVVAKEAAEVASKAKTEFLATISHEIPHADERDCRDGRSAVGHPADS